MLAWVGTNEKVAHGSRDNAGIQREHVTLGLRHDVGRIPFDVGFFDRMTGDARHAFFISS